MPVPMIAPIPSEIRLPAPSVRRSVCSPVSAASPRIDSSGFVTNRLDTRPMIPLVFSCALAALTLLVYRCAQPLPNYVHRDSEQHEDQAGPRVLRFVSQE